MTKNCTSKTGTEPQHRYHVVLFTVASFSGGQSSIISKSQRSTSQPAQCHPLHPISAGPWWREAQDPTDGHQSHQIKWQWACWMITHAEADSMTYPLSGQIAGPEAYLCRSCSKCYWQGASEAAVSLWPFSSPHRCSPKLPIDFCNWAFPLLLFGLGKASLSLALTIM